VSEGRPTACPTLGQACAAEVLGTFILVFFGCGSVHAAVLTGAQSGLWQVAIVWGVAIMLAIYVVGGISGAHINPAITLATAVWGLCPWSKVGPYMIAQFVGAALAAGVLLALYGPFLVQRERELGVSRGERGSELTAMCYGEYYPNPGPLSVGGGRYDPAAHERMNALTPTWAAFAAEVLGTAILALVVFAVTDPRNVMAPTGGLAPVFIGLTVAVLISIIAPLTQACFNPARDFGPRVVAFLAGWGTIALPGPRGGGTFLVYLVAPLVGAIAGGGFYQRLVRTWLPRPSVDGD
jgi:glycerol uptake facilitator protein